MAAKFVGRVNLPSAGTTSSMKSTTPNKSLIKNLKPAAKNGKEEVAKIRCPGCQNEYKPETIAKTGRNVCTRCVKKNQTGGATSKNKMEMCKGSCKKEWTHATLIKYKDENGKSTGMCKKCHDSRNMGPVEKYTTCIAMNQEYSNNCVGGKLNVTTANKFSNICMPCARAICKNWADTIKFEQQQNEQSEQQQEEQQEEQQ